VAILDHLGTRVSLPIRRFGPPGAFLAEDDEVDEVVLLPGAEVPDGAKVGESLEVFIYRDSEDRLIATRATPLLMLDEVAFLVAIDRSPLGVFCDWGLQKDLLVPFAHQTTEMAVGEAYAVALMRDSSDRLIGTMRVSERLRTPVPAAAQNTWMRGEAWRRDDALGVFVILAKRYVGLLPLHEPHQLKRGQAADFRIARVFADGKVELSLRKLQREARGDDAANILQALRDRPQLRIGDRSPPEVIERETGLSKKAFKRAVGMLLRDGRAEVTEEGILRPRVPSSPPHRAPPHRTPPRSGR
jgi:hypothetical protein